MSEHGYIDSGALERSLSSLRTRPSEDTMMDALHRVIGATRELFGATGAGIMMVNDGTVLRAVAATDEAGRRLETLQEEEGEGPCVDALTFDRVIVTDDLAGDDRWPRLVPELPAAGVRAVLGVPLHVERVTVGSLNVYFGEPHSWDESEVRALCAYAELVESVLITALHAHEHEQLADQLQHALDHRVMIERAVGVIMARDQINAVAAFNRLRQIARSSETKVADVADRLLSEIPGNLEPQP